MEIWQIVYFLGSNKHNKYIFDAGRWAYLKVNIIRGKYYWESNHKWYSDIVSLEWVFSLNNKNIFKDINECKKKAEKILKHEEDAIKDVMKKAEMRCDKSRKIIEKLRIKIKELWNKTELDDL